MFTSDFYITSFISMPLSLSFLIAGIAIVATRQRESRFFFWVGTAGAVNISVQYALGALRAFPALDGVHAVMVLIVVANFWAGTMLMLASAVRFEVEHRTTRAVNKHHRVTDPSNSGVPVA